MPDDSKLMKWGVLIAAGIIIIRIFLEQVGAPEGLAFLLGVAWLYFILPVLFALCIRAKNAASPFSRLFKDVVLFAVYTRLMVMATYMLAYVFSWPAQRFAYPGGNVGGNVGFWTGILFIPVRNLAIWIVMATIIGMILGSITLLLRHAPSAGAEA